MWTRTVNGRALHFYLAGINNQNFLMRDSETGSWWQQINGKAIYGPLKGAALDLVPYDELTFGQWKSEVSDGQVLAEVPKYKKKYESDWEPEIAKLPVVISFPGTELKPRYLVVGLQVNGASRAYPWESLVKQSPLVDRVGGMPILVAVAPDGKSFRVFASRIDGKDTEFFLKAEPGSAAQTDSSSAQKTGLPQVVAVKTSVTPASTSAGQAPPPVTATGNPQTAVAQQPPSAKTWVLIDAATASEWNFQGCAVSGPSQGKCLDRIPALKDFWFDWRNYHPDTTIYKR